MSSSLRDLEEQLRRLAHDHADEIARAAAVAIGHELRDAVHQEIDAESGLSDAMRESLHEVVGLSIGGADMPLGMVGVKVGFGVGRRTRRASAKRARGGVGVSANNIHWFALGTRDRYTGEKNNWGRQKATGKPRRYRGRLMPIRVVGRAVDQVAAITQEVASSALLVKKLRGGIQGK